MFKMEKTCTGVSSSCICFCTSEFTHCFISVVLLVVDIPVSQCSASPKKGKRLLLGHGFSEIVNLSMSGLFLNSCIAFHMMGSYDW